MAGKKWFAASLLALFCIGIHPLAFAQQIDRIFVFGDSLSDKGQLYHRTLGILPASPPQFKGRFTNGPIWAEYVDWLLSQTPVIWYAESGSTAVNYQQISPDLQYRFINNLENLFKQFERQQGHLLETDLVMIWLGANDYMTFNWTSEEDILRVIASLADFHQKIIAKGAKHLIYFNLPDLGKVPQAIMDSRQAEMTQVSQLHNAELIKQVQSWQHATVVYPIDQVFEQSIRDAESFGVTNTTQACHIGNWRRALDGVVTLPSHIPDNKRLEIETLLRNPVLANGYLDPQTNLSRENFNRCSKYFFWDIVHPSARIHERLGNRMYQYLIDNFEFKDERAVQAP